MGETSRQRASRKPVEELESSVTQAALAIWREGASGQGDLPPASAIDPVRLRRHLANVVLIDVIWKDDEPGAASSEPADFRYAVIGEASNEAHGVNLSGETVSGLSQFGEAYATNMLAFYRHICRVKAPVAAGGSLRMIGKDYRTFEAVYLPFTRDGSRVDRILAAVVYF